MTAWLLVALIVGATTAGDILTSIGMRRNGEVQSLSPMGVTRFLTGPASPYLIAAVMFMAVSFFSFMKLLTVAPISFAVPATAASVVVETVLARFLLGERVDARRWLGAVLVACGVVLLAA